MTQSNPASTVEQPSEPKLIKYFVRYEKWNHDYARVTVNTEVHMKAPIRGMEDIERIQKIIGKNISNNKSTYFVDVVSWQRFEE